MKRAEQIKDAARFRIAKHGEDRGTASLTPFEVHKLMVDYDNRDKWIPVTERPLYKQTDKGWECTEDGESEFLAAIEVIGGWWIKHCVIEDAVGLCVVGDDENTPAGWEIQDVQYWQPLPKAPKI